MWYTFKRRPRKVNAKTAANSISAPLIIWYTLAVTLRRPIFISIVAIRSKTVGMANRASWRNSPVLPLFTSYM